MFLQKVAEDAATRESSRPFINSAVAAGDAALEPVAKFFNTSKSNIAGAGAGITTALGYYLLSGLWDKKSKHRLKRALQALGVGAGVGLGTKFGLQALRPKIQEIREKNAAADVYNTWRAQRDKDDAAKDANAKRLAEIDKAIQKQEEEYKKEAEGFRQAERNAGLEHLKKIEERMKFAKEHPEQATDEYLRRREKLRRLEKVYKSNTGEAAKLKLLPEYSAAIASGDKEKIAQFDQKLEMAARVEAEYKRRLPEFEAARKLNPIEEEAEFRRLLPLIIRPPL